MPFLSFSYVFIAHLRIFKQRCDGVEAEAGNALLEPERDDVFESLVNLGIVPVEVGLLDIELVVVVLARLLVPLPRGVAEDGLPVVGRLALVGCGLALAVVPHIPVAIGIVFDERDSRNHLCLSEEWFITMSMMHADVALVGFGDQVIEVGQGAVLRIDSFVVGDVVAEVDLRRRIDGREPDGVDAELLSDSRDAAVMPFRSPMPSLFES